MLTQIRCDRFLMNIKIINFNAGLNTVLGSTSGNNDIGKTTFLHTAFRWKRALWKGVEQN